MHVSRRPYAHHTATVTLTIEISGFKFSQLEMSECRRALLNLHGPEPLTLVMHIRGHPMPSPSQVHIRTLREGHPLEPRDSPLPDHWRREQGIAAAEGRALQSITGRLRFVASVLCLVLSG